MYNSYSRDESAILGITIPVIKMGSWKHYLSLEQLFQGYVCYSRNKSSSKGDSHLTNRFGGKLSAMRAGCLGLKHCEESEAGTKFFCICVNMGLSIRPKIPV